MVSRAGAPAWRSALHCCDRHVGRRLHCRRAIYRQAYIAGAYAVTMMIVSIIINIRRAGCQMPKTRAKTISISTWKYAKSAKFIYSSSSDCHTCSYVALPMRTHTLTGTHFRSRALLSRETGSSAHFSADSRKRTIRTLAVCRMFIPADFASSISPASSSSTTCLSLTRRSA